MNQNHVDLYVHQMSQQQVDEDIIRFYNDEKKWGEKKAQLQDELLRADTYLKNANDSLICLAESYRKIQREMPERPQSQPAGRNFTFDAIMPTVVAGSHERGSETASNPYLVAGRP